MTEDESDCSRDDKRLSTIEEESALSASYQRRLGYEETIDNTINQFKRDEAACASLLSESTDTEPSCISTNSTLPVLPPPTKNDLLQLQDLIKETCITPPSAQIPITKSTYGVLNRFASKEKESKALSTAITPKQGTLNFSSELKLAIQNLHLIDEWGNLKIELIQSLSTPCKTSKSFYNYLLLDPKVIKKVNFSGTYLKSDVIKNPEKFETFLRSVFYIGKGCGKRPIQHLVDAKEIYAGGRKSGGKSRTHGQKLDKILEIWKSGLGVIVVSVFHYSAEKEANVNEASMIDAVGLVELSNIKKGSYSGTLANSWTQKVKNQFGSFLLYKSFCAFAVSEHKSFFPQDI